MNTPLVPVCCFKGRGIVSIAEAAAYKAGTAGAMPVGNAMDFTVTADVSEDSQKNMMTAAGGNHCVDYTVDKVTVGLKITCQDARNLAIAMNGEFNSNSAASVVTDESHKSFKGSTIVLENPAASVQAVTGSSGSPTYVAGTDYVLQNGALSIPATSTIPDGASILIDYTAFAKQDTVELFTHSGKEYFVFFAGQDKVSKAVVNEKLFKVRFKPAEFNALSENLSSIDLEGEALPDDTVQTGGLLSQYGSIKLAI